ncbi:hypothetical protein AAG906_021651 [Vitis piasezkii]
MTSTPILAMPNFNEPFIVETNASEEGIGVSKHSWSTYAKEMLAILQAVRTWRLYLLGRKIFIQTDQRSLKYFMEQRIRTLEQQNRVAKLLGYNYVIVVSGSPILNALFVPHVELWADIKSATKDHPYMDHLC